MVSNVAKYPYILWQWLFADATHRGAVRVVHLVRGKGVHHGWDGG